LLVAHYFELQWSRDDDVAESSGNCGICGLRVRFNGAATMMSRKGLSEIDQPGMGGDSFNGAATMMSRKGKGVPDTTAADAALQWSRDDDVAERPPSQP